MTMLFVLTAVVGRSPAAADPRVLAALGGDPTSAALFAFCSTFAAGGGGTLPPARVRRACELCGDSVSRDGDSRCPTPYVDHDDTLSRRHEADLLLAGKLEREGEAASRHESVSGALHAIDNATLLDESNRSNSSGVVVGGNGSRGARPPSPPSTPPPPPLPMMAALRANLYANLQTSTEMLQGQRALEDGIALVVSEGVVLALMVAALCCCCVMRVYKFI